MKSLHFIYMIFFFLTILSCREGTEPEVNPEPPAKEDPYDSQGRIIGYLKWTESYDSEELFGYSQNEKYYMSSIVNKIRVESLNGTNEQEYENLMRRVLGEIEIVHEDGTYAYDVILKELRHKKKRIHELLMNEQTKSIRDFYYIPKEGSSYPPYPYGFSFSSEVVVKFWDYVDISEKETILKTFNLKLITDAMPVFESYAVPKGTDVLAVANQLYETGFFKFVHPYLIEYLVLHGSSFNDYTPSFEQRSPDTLFGTFIRSQNDTLLCFNIPPDSLNLDIRKLPDGTYPLQGDSISFNSQYLEGKEMEYYEIASPSEQFLSAPYRQIIITDIKKH